MKKFFYIALSACLLWACGKETPDVPETPVNPAPKAITLSTSSFEVGKDGGEQSLIVTSPFRPVLSGVPAWITVKDGTFDAVKYQISYDVSVAANETYEQRTAEITLSATGVPAVSFAVKQEAAPKPEPPVVDPDEGISKKVVTENPTAEVQALYTYLYGQYGKKMISSVMADVNWNHRIADNVKTWTGKYPAMNCYDFIHIYVPKNNWIDYSNLTPVTEWAAAGGIVSLMWHFNVPKNGSVTPGADGSGVTCTPSETSFRATNVFTEGTWENKWFYQEMDKVVNVILALQEKGIAAIWRPFHEGAGNATLKSGASWGKAWFWWGYDGAEVYKKLWITMFNYFKAKGVRNLIWVWTTQNYNGDASQYNQDKEWYPGASFVDIVARDLYGKDKAANALEFKEIQAQYPSKMVTLGECGKDGNTAYADMTDAWNAGAKWSWFMPWYGSNLPDQAWWVKVMGSDSVLSREDVKY